MQSVPARVTQRNVAAQIILGAAVIACVCFGWRELHPAQPGVHLVARTTRGLPGPFLHGLIPGRTQLIQAVLSRRGDQALALIQSSPEQVNSADSLGWTPLIASAYRGDPKIAAALLAAGASTTPATRNGKTALLYAVQEGAPAVAALLITHGADTNAVDQGGATPLMWAALQGDTAVCKPLIAAGADVNRQDRRGYTALSVAALAESDAVVQLLLAHGANPAAGAGRGDDLPLATALDSDDPGSAAALIDAGAPVNARTEDGFTPLMLAVQNGLPRSVVDMLLARGADAAAITGDGTTALCYACAAPGGSLPVVSDLIRRGASVTQGPSDQTTPLMYAAEAGHADIVRLLLARGADVKTVTNRGMTALHWADGEGYASQIGAQLRGSGAMQ